MHIRTLLFSLLAFTITTNAMEFLYQLAHTLDKNYVDPVLYITDVTSSDLCDDVLAFDPQNRKYKPFIADTESLEKVHRVFEREQKLLQVIKESICDKGSYTEVEQIIRNVKKEYYSAHAYAIIYGYLETKIQRAEEDAQSLKNYPSNKGVAQPQVALRPDSTNNSAPESLPHGSRNNNEKKDYISPSALNTLILDSNYSYAGKLFNYARKTAVDPIGYLTNSKSSTVSEAVLRFNPQHPHPCSLNPSLDLHLQLIHNACERQRRLLNAVEAALKANDAKTIMKLQSIVKEGYFSTISKAVIAGYLKSATLDKVLDNQVRREQVNHSQHEIASISNSAVPAPKIIDAPIADSTNTNTSNTNRVSKLSTAQTPGSTSSTVSETGKSSSLRLSGENIATRIAAISLQPSTNASDACTIPTMTPAKSISTTSISADTPDTWLASFPANTRAIVTSATPKDTTTTILANKDVSTVHATSVALSDKKENDAKTASAALLGGKKK